MGKVTQALADREGWKAFEASHFVWEVTNPKGEVFFVAPASDKIDAMAKAQGKGTGEYQVASRVQDLDKSSHFMERERKVIDDNGTVIKDNLNPREAAIDKALAEGGAPVHEGLPVHGYNPQPNANVMAVNHNKELEETLLRVLDGMKTNPDIDGRWLAIGRTHLEQGFMAVNRAIFKPGRVKLYDDGAAARADNREG